MDFHHNPWIKGLDLDKNGGPQAQNAYKTNVFRGWTSLTIWENEQNPFEFIMFPANKQEKWNSEMAKSIWIHNVFIGNELLLASLCGNEEIFKKSFKKTFSAKLGSKKFFQNNGIFHVAA